MPKSTTSAPNATNLRPVNDGDKTRWPTIGCRVRPSERFLIDEAVLKIQRERHDARYKRSDFIVEAAIQRALEVLGYVKTEQPA